MSAGEAEQAAQMHQRATHLRQRFDHDFWLAARGIYAMALRGDGTALSVIASNPGHALWAGFADADKARRPATPQKCNMCLPRTVLKQKLKYLFFIYMGGGVFMRFLRRLWQNVAIPPSNIEQRGFVRIVLRIVR